MPCTLKIIAGPDAGQQFLANGEQTVIGRSPRCSIRLNAPSISYEHALISRTGDDFFVENLSAAGTFLNNDRLAARTRLRTKDQIRLGPDTIARVEALPASSPGNASPNTRRLLVLILAIMIILGIAFVALDPFSTTAAYNWPHAYSALQQFTTDESAAGRLPSEIPALFREAWRLESANDRTNASKAWLHLNVLLDNADEKSGTHFSASQTRSALIKLLQPDPAAKSPPSQDDLHAALTEFVKTMERRK